MPIAALLEFFTTAPPAVSTAPIITSVSPSAGSVIGGTTIAISGINFGQGVTVWLGDSVTFWVPATGVVRTSPQSILATVPASPGLVSRIVHVAVNALNGEQAIAFNAFTWLAAPAGLEVQIGSLIKTTATQMNSSVRGSMVLGSRSTLSMNIYDPDSTSAAYRPQLDEPYLLTHPRYGVLFNGTIQRVRDMPLGDPDISTVTQVDVADVTMLLDRLRLTWESTFPMPLRDHIFAVSEILSNVGIITDPAMLLGPMIPPQKYDNVKITDVLNRVSVLSGWVYRVTWNRILQYYPIGYYGGYPLSESMQVVRSLRWERSRTQYWNYVVVRYGPDGTQDITDTFVGDGATSSFKLRAPLVGNAAGYVRNGISGGAPLNETFAIAGQGFDLAVYWLYYAEDQTIRRVASAGPPTAGNPIAISYQAQYPLTAVVWDQSEINQRGMWSEEFRRTDIIDAAAAIEYGNAQLRRGTSILQRVTLITTQGPFLPGEIVVLTFPKRMVTGTFLVTEVEFADEADGELIWSLTLLEGNPFTRNSWIDFYRDLLGGLSNS